MDRITAAMMLFGYTPPECSTLRELIVRAALTTFDFTDEVSSPYRDATIIGPLVDAYVALLRNKGKEPTLVTGREADNKGLWRWHALRGYREFFPKTPIDSEALPWWPDEMPLDTSYPKGLLCDLAFLAGYTEGRRTQAFYEFVRREDEQRRPACQEGKP